MISNSSPRSPNLDIIKKSGKTGTINDKLSSFCIVFLAILIVLLISLWIFGPLYICDADIIQMGNIEYYYKNDINMVYSMTWTCHHNTYEISCQYDNIDNNLDICCIMDEINGCDIDNNVIITRKNNNKLTFHYILSWVGCIFIFNISSILLCLCNFKLKKCLYFYISIIVIGLFSSIISLILLTLELLNNNCYNNLQEYFHIYYNELIIKGYTARLGFTFWGLIISCIFVLIQIFTLIFHLNPVITKLHLFDKFTNNVNKLYQSNKNNNNNDTIYYKRFKKKRNNSFSHSNSKSLMLTRADPDIDRASDTY